MPCLYALHLLLQIASMLDSGSLRIEGVMPGGAKNAYTLPLDVYCFGQSEAVRSTLQMRLVYAGTIGRLV